MFGSERAFSVDRIAPRSSATTFSPACANSLLKIPPVQPSPTTTTSTSLSFVTMTRPQSAFVARMKRSEMREISVPGVVGPGYRCAHPGYRVCARSAHIRDAERAVCGEFLVPVFLDVLAMHRDRAGEADQLPAGLVAVAAMDRIGEHAFHDALIKRRPEHAHRQAVVEGDLRAREGDQHLLALLRAQ